MRKTLLIALMTSGLVMGATTSIYADEKAKSYVKTQSHPGYQGTEVERRPLTEKLGEKKRGEIERKEGEKEPPWDFQADKHKKISETRKGGD